MEAEAILRSHEQVPQAERGCAHNASPTPLARPAAEPRTERSRRPSRHRSERTRNGLRVGSPKGPGSRSHSGSQSLSEGGSARAE